MINTVGSVLGNILYIICMKWWSLPKVNKFFVHENTTNVVNLVSWPIFARYFLPHTCWIWSNSKQCHSICRPRKPHRRTNQTWSGSDDPLRRYGHLKFSKMWGRSLDGRWSVGRQLYFLHWCHILLFATLGMERSMRGVKNHDYTSLLSADV